MERWQYVKLFNTSSNEFKVNSGVPQGGHLSLLLFNLCVNYIFHNARFIRLLHFADDAKLFSHISSNIDCHRFCHRSIVLLNVATLLALLLTMISVKLYHFPDLGLLFTTLILTMTHP